jgi:hypothetical protein
VKGCSRGTKWLYFENLSTITSIQLTDPDLGMPLMKSMEIVWQASSGTGSGEKRPGYLLLLGLACWLVVQDLTKARVSAFIPYHANNCFNLLYVTGNPKCPPIDMACKACKI